MSRSACSVIARTTLGWQCPTLLIEMPAMQLT